MKKESLLEKFLLSNPFKRGMAEWVILIISGICGLMLSWYNFSIFPITNIFGVALIIFAFLFHVHSEKNHKNAHEKTENIKHIVTSGVYSKIRHPLYLSLIIFNLGIAFSFGVLITLILAVITSVHWGMTSYFEEQKLEKMFGDEYTQYKQSVKWRMVPGIF